MMPKVHTRNNFSLLTLAIVAVLLLEAMLMQFLDLELHRRLAGRVVEGALVLTLLAGLWSIRRAHVWYRTGLVLLFGVILITAASLLVDLAGLHYLHLLSMLGFFALSTWVAARQVLFSGHVDWNQIVGAMCLFLLLGIDWTLLYLLADTFGQEAFNGVVTGPWYEKFGEFAYYSFVTLTTLGYGDISPAQPVPRVLAYLEALVGQFYIAIVVATMVGARMAQRDSAAPKGEQ